MFASAVTAGGLSALASASEENYQVLVQERQKNFPPKLMKNWTASGGFLQVELPSVTMLPKHRRAARKAAFPWKEGGLFGDKILWLMLCRLYDLYRILPASGHPQALHAYWVGVHFHHFAASRVPGFWNAYNYAEKEKLDFRLKFHFKNQATIIFHGFGSANGVSNGTSVLSISYQNGRQRSLIHRVLSNDPPGEDCYSEHLSSGKRFPCWELPNARTRSAIVEAFAMLAALP